MPLTTATSNHHRQQLIDLLTQGFRRKPPLARFEPAAICLDDIRTYPSRGFSQRRRTAICVSAEHQNGEAADVYLPYKKGMVWQDFIRRDVRGQNGRGSFLYDDTIGHNALDRLLKSQILDLSFTATSAAVGRRNRRVATAFRRCAGCSNPDRRRTSRRARNSGSSGSRCC